MLLMGQEFGESRQLGFRKSDFLRSRFYGMPEHRSDGDRLRQFYKRMIDVRYDHLNRALFSANRWVTNPRSGHDERILAQSRWDHHSGSNVVFTFFNLWDQGEIRTSYFIPPELGSRLSIDDQRRYRFVNILANTVMGPCRTGAEIKWEIPLTMHGHERVH